MGTPYEVVYNRFLQKISDYKLLSLPEEDVEAILYSYLVSAIAKTKQCQNDLGDRDEENKCFNSTLLDIEIEILALQMVCEWVEPQLNNVLYTKQFIGSKDCKTCATVLLCRQESSAGITAIGIQLTLMT